jgi:ComF family protein
MMTMKEKLKDVSKAILDLLFPPSCSYCKEATVDSDKYLCQKCFSQHKFIKTPYCTCCGRVFSSRDENHLCGDCLKSSWAFDKARSLFSYEEVIAGLIHNLKYSEVMTGFNTFRWLSKQSTLLDDLTVPDVILPVPLHIKRLRQRGFNQALLLAKALFSDDKKKIRHDLLARQVDTPSQTGLSGIERRKNLRNAFVIKTPSSLNGKNVLIFDDVFTTGSTIHECAKVLKSAGANRIEALTICRADKIFS